ncbi:hypothetical protein TD95_004379 [Thielaviopsis punctulata]|uniref:DUF8032 domain-containing protein n=1 Tax=Thielaviopsis punctulata TaxID=72032 RepID=A0A0F4ZED7_9PEZI|nr:hypothetical protein TD95_004379 [Thielaviopsis punctulata]
MGLQQPQPHSQAQTTSYPTSRPSSIVQQQQQHQPPTSTGYPSPHSIASVYPQSTTSTNGPQDASLPQYYSHATASPYSNSQPTSAYSPADTSEMMAATQMPRHPYPAMSYQPQGSAPNSVAPSPQHDQHRSIYGQPPSQAMQQTMYYPPQQQYQPMPSQAPSPYGQHAAHNQHAQHQQAHQPMTSQPAMMMSHAASHNSMAQHTQHQSLAANSPRNPKMEIQTHHMQKSAGSMNTGHSSGSVTPLATPTGAAPQAVNPNAAPGPIPATTPLVVRQDQNGVQWIAFEYSRDRVKMEYTIRCDVESINTDELSQEFKTENCVYPRACCPKEQYRGNRQVYETECNTVGWALAQLNPTLRGKRGLIQRAVDSWRNSNQDPRLRSRRVRRMAKMNNRKAMQSQTQAQAAHMAGAHMAHMGKPPVGTMGQPMHHQHHAPEHHQHPHHMQHHQHAHQHPTPTSTSTTPTGEEMNIFSHQM